MTVKNLSSSPAAESVRLIAYDTAQVVSGIVKDTYFLVVSGQAPCVNMQVSLSPRIYIDCPDYWAIEVVGSLPGGFCLTATKPYSVAIPLTGITGSSGVRVVGASNSEDFEVPGGCRSGGGAPDVGMEGTGAGAASDRFRDGQAVADFQPIVDPEPLRVRVDYRLNRRSGSVRLQERRPQGINPTELSLDLVIEGPGLGGDWVPAEGTFRAAPGQYRTVNIFDRDGEHVVIEVQELH